MFTFNNAEYKVVARTTNDFGEVAEIAVNNNGESLKEFKKRAMDIYPYTEGWHHRYSEFKEIY